MDIARPERAAALRRKRLVLAGVGVALLAAAGIALATLEPRAPRVARASVFVDTVQEGEFVRRVRGNGVLVPREQRWIAAATDGRVERVNVRPGASVAADTVLLELSNPEVEQLAADARGALAAANAELAALRVKLESEVLDQRARIAEARANYESARLQAEAEGRLAGQHVISELQMARSRLTAEQLGVRLQIEQERLPKLETAVRAQVAAQQARVDQVRSSWERRSAELAALQVRAGLDGVLQALQAEVGQRFAAGANLARVAKPGELRAELRIPEIDARGLAVGQRAEIDTRSGKVAGRVERVDPAVQNGTVAVDVALDGPLPEGTRADLTVEGVVEIERLGRALHVARPVNVRPQGPASLFRVAADGTATRVAVRLGQASADRVVVQSGLAPGDRVIVSDLSEYARQDRLVLE